MSNSDKNFKKLGDSSEELSVDDPKKELVTELLSSLNNENITSLTIEDYDSQRYMLCITIQQSFFDDDPTPSKIRDFINDTKQIASKHSNKIFQYYITIISQGIKTRFCSYPTGDENKERFYIKYYDNGEVTDSIVYFLDTAEEVYENNSSDQKQENNSTAPPSTPQLTNEQLNALSTARDYLHTMAFSYTGLIEQLKFEGYSEEDATYAADNCNADWNEQAAKKAQEYIDTMSFSRSSLIEQLQFEGFTTEQAEYGVSSVGY